MAIEFRCTQCGKLLRTGDDTAGRQAQCPACGALSTIPGPEQGAAPIPPLAPLGSEPSVAPGSAPGSPFGAGGATGPGGPYQSAGAYVYEVPSEQGRLLAAARVSGPATALMVTAILSMLLDLGGIAFLLTPAARMGHGAAFHQNELAPNFPLVVGPGVQATGSAFSFLIAVVILIGAIRMKTLQNHGFAMTVAIIAMIPCVSPCCLLGLPFGIWAIVVLNDPSVRAAFRS